MSRSQPSKEGHWHGKNVRHRYLGKSLFAFGEGDEGGEGERRDAHREREFGALLAQDAKRRLPHDRTSGDRHHNLQAPAGALVCTRGSAESFVRKWSF